MLTHLRLTHLVYPSDVSTEDAAMLSCTLLFSGHPVPPGRAMRLQIYNLKYERSCIHVHIDICR